MWRGFGQHKTRGAFISIAIDSSNTNRMRNRIGKAGRQSRRNAAVILKFDDRFPLPVQSTTRFHFK